VINEKLTTDRIATQETKPAKNLTKLAELTWKQLKATWNTTCKLVPKSRGFSG
jgi:hypothetical protein